jgi:hypothetical protein
MQKSVARMILELYLMCMNNEILSGYQVNNEILSSFTAAIKKAGLLDCQVILMPENRVVWSPAPKVTKAAIKAFKAKKAAYKSIKKAIEDAAKGV